MTGIYFDMPFEDYVSAPGINQSGLKLFDRSPSHYFDKYLAPDLEIRDESEALRRGHFVHAAILEPELFSSRYLPALDKDDYPDAIVTIEDLRLALDQRKVAFKKSDRKADLISLLVESDPSCKNRIWDQILADYDNRSANKSIISLTDWNLCIAIKKRVQSHPTAQLLMDSGHAEASIFWTDTETGVRCKMRCDWLMQSGLLDFKTTEDASEIAFKKSIANYKYHIQAAFYLDGWAAATDQAVAPDSFIFAACETKRPHELAFYYADADMLAEGRAVYRHWLRQYADCLNQKIWPGYPQEIQKISLPKWALKGLPNVTEF